MLGIGAAGPRGEDRRRTTTPGGAPLRLGTRAAGPAGGYDGSPAVPGGGRAGTPAGRDGDGPARRGRGAARGAERDAWAILASVQGLGPVAFGRLVARFGTAREVLAAARTEAGGAAIAALDAASEFPRPAGHRFAALAPEIARAATEADARLAPVRRLELEVVTLDDSAYPPRLRAIELPPPVLFVRGDVAALDAAHAVAVVGTRRPSETGRRVAARIASAAADSGAVVVSGLAVGIDGAAHAAAVAEGHPTVAVLAGGHAHLYPGAHAGLADAIVRGGGAVVTEMAPTTEPTAGLFPRRNRIISGLADATVVVEAGERSGALITASWALEQGRECFLVPGPIDAPRSVGCLAFLRAFPGAARIVAGIPELLVDLELVAEDGSRSSRRRADDRAAAPRSRSLGALLAGLGDTEQAVARRLVAGDATVDELVAASGLPVATLLGALTLLEMRGLASGAYGRYRPAGRLASVEPERVPHSTAST